MQRTFAVTCQPQKSAVDGFHDVGGGYNPGFHRGAPYPPRYRGGGLHAHRHRTLVLNGATSQNRSNDVDAGTASDTAGSSWVSRNDRHLQLINTAVYQKDAQARTRAIEETRRKKQIMRDRRERAKLAGHFNRVAGGSSVTNAQEPTAKYEVTLDGVRFIVAKNGSKLIKAPGTSHPSEMTPSCLILSAHSNHAGDDNSAQATPKIADVGGVKFYRSKNGNLYRHGIVKAQRYVFLTGSEWPLTSHCCRRSGIVKKVDVSCKTFSTTGTSHLQRRAAEARRNHGCDIVCMWAQTDQIPVSLGSCPKGPHCRYLHDPARVAACKDLLQKGQCPNGDACDLSHDLTPERTPTCLHFMKDHCTNPNCRYAHVKVSSGAPVCRAFGLFGYCDKGVECPERHSNECPDFSNSGVCNIKGCKLPHRERASVLRKNAAGREKTGDEDQEMEDVSSDDDGDSIDSDDVDSDEVEEFIGEEDGLDFEQQRDFIQFS